MNFRLLPEVLAVSRMEPGCAVPKWADGGWTSVTRTASELSIVCEAERVPAGVRSQQPWRALEIQGPLDFSEIGILAQVSDVLKRASVSIFVLSTYDTDIILVAETDLETAVKALEGHDHHVLG
ncbi:MAG: ACT domain-containing protein [Xanthomonadales bacterium]|nr:ACT domain-containing protein [Xanthomonadales bacterium]